MHALVRTLFRSLLAGVATLALAACGSGERAQQPPGSGDHFYDNFQTAVASVPNRDYDIYWLGREFSAGGMLFSGPHFPDFGGDVTESSVAFHYTGTRVSLELSFISPGYWPSVADRFTNQPGAISERVTVAGSDGQLLLIPGAGRPVNSATLIVILERSVVVASVNSTTTGGAGGVPDANPLIDVETFLAVTEELRPYPE
ncbi:MAG: hypothetical protein WEC75_03300 [Dehalococcoidia bacterium]